MEMLSGGPLLEKIQNSNPPPSESDIANIFRGAVEAIENLHDRKYIHRDLKSDNIIFVSKTNSSQVKIIDFGSMVQLSESGKMIDDTPHGTPGYLAPETISQNEYSYKTDVWQLGCILFL